MAMVNYSQLLKVTADAIETIVLLRWRRGRYEPERAVFLGVKLEAPVAAQDLGLV